jgi:HTH-type transcriptional regulator/antitoxin HigA
MTSQVRIIRTRDEYEAALARLAVLMRTDLASGSDEEDEFELLRLVVADFEGKHQQPCPVQPLDAIAFRMGQQRLSRKDLVPYIGSLSRVSDVLAGRRPLTLAMMRRLHQGLGIPAASLIGADDQVSLDDDEPQYDYTKFPLAEMAERGLLGGRKFTAKELREDAENLVTEFMHQTCGGSLPEQARLRAPMHQNGARSMDHYALIVWRARVLCKAKKSPPRGHYKEGVITDAWLRDVAKLSAFDGGPRLAQEQLSRHGICLVFERHFKKTYLDGAAMLEGTLPVIGLTLRHDRVDNFWFALLHELVHVGKHLRPGHAFIADNLEDKTRLERAEEEQADEGAREALIPTQLWERAAVRSTHSVDDALSLAREAGVHPAIVAGRLRHVTGNWRLLASLISSAGSVSQYFEDQLA